MCYDIGKCWLVVSIVIPYLSILNTLNCFEFNNLTLSYMSK